MKINLLLNNPKDIRSGYINVDPFAILDDPFGRQNGEPNNLDFLVDNNEATEIIAHDILDRYTNQEVNEILDHWLTKLAHGGELVISMVDIREVSRAVISNSLPLDEVNRLLYGDQDHKVNFKKISLTLEYLTKLLESKGMQVLKKRISNFRAVVAARRT